MSNFTVESLWGFESKFLYRLHSISVQNNLWIYTAVRENLSLFTFRLSDEIIRMQYSSRPLNVTFLGHGSVTKKNYLQS